MFGGHMESIARVFLAAGLLSIATFFNPSAHAACDVAREQKALTEWIDKTHDATRNKRHDVNRKWQKQVEAILRKHALVGDAAKAYIAALSEKVAAASKKTAKEHGNEELTSQVLDAVFAANDLESLSDACAQVPKFKKRIAELIGRIDRQLDADWAVTRGILDAELANPNLPNKPK